MYLGYGYACCGCGSECSGMGVCDTCDKAMCFLCAEILPGKGRYCPECYEKLEKKNDE